MSIEPLKKYNLVFTEYGNQQVTEEKDITPEQTFSEPSDNQTIEDNNSINSTQSTPQYTPPTQSTPVPPKEKKPVKPAENVTAKTVYFHFDNNTLDDEPMELWANNEKSKNKLALAVHKNQEGDTEDSFKLFMELLKTSIDKTEKSWVRSTSFFEFYYISSPLLNYDI